MVRPAATLRWCAAASLAVLTSLSGCTCDKKRGGGGKDVELCKSACGALVTAGCTSTGLREADFGPCLAACRAEDEKLAPAGCGEKRAAYLSCVSSATLECAAAKCSAAKCLEHATGLAGCAAEHAAYRECIEPCLLEGTVHVGTRDAGEFSYVREGCGECGPLKRGVAAGGACTAAKVCSDLCCGCPGSPSVYRGRVCARGVCAAKKAGCAVICAEAARQ